MSILLLVEKGVIEALTWEVLSAALEARSSLSILEELLCVKVVKSVSM